MPYFMSLGCCFGFVLLLPFGLFKIELSLTYLKLIYSTAKEWLIVCQF